MPLHYIDVLADQPFAEIGEPTLVVDDPAHDFLVIAGDLGYSLWFGDGRAKHAHARVGVYDRGTLACRQVATIRWPANDVAIHPSGTLVAVGTGSHDGGYMFEGELVILNLDRGQQTSALRHERQVCTVRWLDDTRLAVALAPPTDDLADDWEGLTAESFELEAAWDDIGERALDLSGTTGDPVPFDYPKPDLDAARSDLERVAARGGRSWAPRRAVWSVAGRSDGSVIAACEGVAAERWDPSGGPLPMWRTPTAGAGRQLKALTETTLMATIEISPPSEDSYGYRRESQHHVVDVETGTILNSVTRECASVVVASRGGYSLLRPVSMGGGAPDGLMIDLNGRAVGSMPLTRYDLFNHWFDIAGAPDILILSGKGGEAHLDKWVARVVVRADGRALERLFPLDWQGPKQRHLFGGPGVFVDDALGSAVIHCGEVHAYSGKHSPFAIRRSYPDGTPRWTLDLPGTATGAVEVDGVMAVTTVNGWLVLADAATGALHESTELHIDTYPVVPLSVGTLGDSRLAIGLLDGRILRVELG
ncbi:hypothetical protein OEB99_02305 [Actinotalea sp. M2MS4P-6]|uniref:hypothetical protein n=1 Tax=Actinotalea sp. M2MS4P-6 TaxID=2983762 RepID=UPI0021E37EE8|nr:hypothetical protein [Actinotalea sp. M2MS4P-6]MCV2393131.1 hypothetical protein [Actinotalea sp. M2MS4P-6]